MVLLRNNVREAVQERLFRIAEEGNVRTPEALTEQPLCTHPDITAVL